ncbi:hypothetical protein ACWEKM_41435 [Streptomyces sp. NPDC004752]
MEWLVGKLQEMPDAQRELRFPGYATPESMHSYLLALRERSPEAYRQFVDQMRTTGRPTAAPEWRFPPRPGPTHAHSPHTDSDSPDSDSPDSDGLDSEGPGSDTPGNADADPYGSDSHPSGSHNSVSNDPVEAARQLAVIYEARARYWWDQPDWWDGSVSDQLSGPMRTVEFGVGSAHLGGVA